MSKARRKIGVAISAYTIVFISMAFFILPLLWIIYCSFRTQASIFTGKVFAPLHEFTLENYTTILSVTDYPTYFMNSFKIATVVSLLALIFSIAGAYGLSRFKIKGKNAIILGIFSTQMFPQVLLIIPMYLIVFSFQMLDTVIGVVLGQLILVLPFSIWMLKGYFDIFRWISMTRPRRLQYFPALIVYYFADGRAGNHGCGFFFICGFMGRLPHRLGYQPESEDRHGDFGHPASVVRPSYKMGSGRCRCRSNHRAYHCFIFFCPKEAG